MIPESSGGTSWTIISGLARAAPGDAAARVAEHVPAIPFGGDDPGPVTARVGEQPVPGGAG